MHKRGNGYTHLNVLISRLTSADIQSTITPDEGRNVPWHYNSVHGVNTAKQALNGLDGILEMVELKKDGPLKEKVRELKERAVLFLRRDHCPGGLCQSSRKRVFVDSGFFPERNGDGIARDPNGGNAADTVVPRKKIILRLFATISDSIMFLLMLKQATRFVTVSVGVLYAILIKSSILMSLMRMTMFTLDWRKPNPTYMASC